MEAYEKTAEGTQKTDQEYKKALNKLYADLTPISKEHGAHIANDAVLKVFNNYDGENHIYFQLIKQTIVFDFLASLLKYAEHIDDASHCI